MIQFGTGDLIAVPTNLADGTAIANPTPVRLGGLQDVSVDLGVDLKTLYGAGKYPIAVGQGKAKTDIKAKYADITASVLGSLFWGKTASNAIRGAVMNTSGTIPTTPFQITAAPPSSGTFLQDLGVRDATTGVVYTRVASAPATGQYAVNGSGVYTFAAADTGKTVLYSYEYSAATGGQLFTLTNDLMGYTPSFSVILQQKYDGKTLVLKFNRAVSGKLSVPYKNDDFMLSDFEATAFTDAADILGYACLF